MDYTPELLAFQGAILTADDVHSISGITSRGGNEKKVGFILNTLRTFLEGKYIDANGVVLNNKTSTLRKFVMYMILNTDLNVTHDMMDIIDLEPIIWSAPILSKYLMCEVIWKLHLEPFIYELIAESWPQLGIEVAESFLHNFKYLGPVEYLPKIKNLCVACYKLMCRLSCFLIEDDNDTVKCLSDVLQKLLMLYINVPNKHRLDILSTDDLYRYKGERLRSVLLLVHECFKAYTSRVTVSDDDAVYRLTYNKDYVKVTMTPVCDTPNKDVLEFLDNTNISLLDIFQEVVMDTSVEMFCAWSEFEEDGKTVQRILGELCDKVQTKLLNISSVATHPVVPMLELMARKPTDIKDIINSMETPEILEKINNSTNEDAETYLHALVFKDNLWENNELIDVIDSKIDMFSDTECLALCNKIRRCTSDDSEREKFFIILRLKLFDKCTVDDKHKILKEHFKEKVLVDTIRQNYDYEGYLTEMFNKIVSNIDADVTEVLAVFYQVPAMVYERIFQLSTQNKLLIDQMLKVMMVLKDYGEYYYNEHTESCLIRNMKTILNSGLDMNQGRNIIRFIFRLKRHQLVTSSQLLILVIMPGVYDALYLKHAGRLHVHVKLLTTAYTKEELSDYKAPIVVTMAQILMTVRKVELRLKAFEIEALATAETVVRFLKSFISTFNEDFTTQERSWMRQKLFALNLHPINFYYFKTFWNSDDTSLVQCVTQQPVRSGLVFALRLSQVLPWAILSEWYQFWDNFVAKKINKRDILNVFHTAVSSLTKLVNTQRTQNTFASLLFCFKNYFQVIRYKYFDGPIVDAEVQYCMSLLSENLALTSPDDVNEIETILMPLFSFLSEKKVNFRNNIVSYFANGHFVTMVYRFVVME